MGLEAELNAALAACGGVDQAEIDDVLLPALKARRAGMTAGMTTASFEFKMTSDGRFTDVREVRMTKLEQVARAMFENIEWRGIRVLEWERSKPGLRAHYIAQAAVCINALRSEDPVWNECIDAILRDGEKPE
jgi:hypothetical protein